MSISPSQVNKGSESSSSFPCTNPNLNHGFTQSQHETQLSQSSNSVSGSIADSPTDYSGSSSSQKVIGHGTSNGENKSTNQNTFGKLQSNLVAQGTEGPAQPYGDVSISPPSRRSTGTSGRRSQIVNGNHLLNFQYNPVSRTRVQPRGPPMRKPMKTQPYNRDLFLQANYRFVVLDSGDYTLESMDPDKMLQWEDIISVKYSTSHPVQCPICLDKPLCPQITSCGHIFCFPCILQYLLMGEENYKVEVFRKCPLCFMMISSKNLYTIDIEDVNNYNVGDTMEFMLLTRRKDSFSLHEKKGGLDTRSCESFSKFILTSDVELSVREAISALDNWLVRADSGLVDDVEKLPYVCAALEQLKQRKKYWNSHCNSGANKSCNPKYEAHELGFGTLPVGIGNTNKGMDKGGTYLTQSFDTVELLEGLEGVSSSSYDEKERLQSQPHTSKDAMERDSYNFYQAIDGQHIILHPLNMKCLLHHYGTYDLLPTRISGKILQLESLTQTEAIRRRYRYLSHFPLTTTFQLCEIDLRGILPLESLSPFMDEIKNREKQRRRIAKKEHEDKIKADAIAAYSLPIPYNTMQAYDHSPAFSMDDFEALGSFTPASTPPVHGERLLFSSVARLGFAAAHDSPALNVSESSPNVERSTESSDLTGSRNQGACSFANVMSRDKSSESVGACMTNETRKKGKKQNRVLFSTAGGRRY